VTMAMMQSCADMLLALPVLLECSKALQTPGGKV